MSDEKTAEAIDQLRESLATKLGELHRRATHAKQLLTPDTYWKNPWLRFGLGAAVGLAIGLSGRRKNADGVLVAAPHESIGHALVRTGLTAVLTAVVTRALNGPLALPSGAPPADAGSSSPR